MPTLLTYLLPSDLRGTDCDAEARHWRSVGVEARRPDHHGRTLASSSVEWDATSFAVSPLPDEDVALATGAAGPHADSYEPR